MKGELINVGTEILLGDILNTNAQYISKELSLLGIGLYYHTSVGDNPQRLLEVLEQARKRSDLVLVTGGLGPTQDDLTKETVATLFGLDLIVHEETLDWIRSYFQKMSAPMTQNNYKQALVPEGARTLPNPNGTAPGILLERDEKVFILLPGPPCELIPMFRDHCIPYLEGKNPNKFSSRYYKLAGLGESAAEDLLLDLIEGQVNPTIATYAKPGEVLIRVTANGKDPEEAEKILQKMEPALLERIGPWVFAREDIELHEALARLLMEQQVSLSVAESCTGGRIACKLTEVAGISSIFHSGIVCYSNEAKVDYLGVKQQTLDRFGAVSRECAIEMLDGLLKRNQTRAALVTTGIAGPGGGSPEKPVGLVYIGCVLDGKREIQEVRFPGDRTQIQQRSTSAALNLLRNMMQGD